MIASIHIPSLAAEITQRTCRTDFSAPGFSVTNVGRAIDSVAFRQLMVDLKSAMSAIHETATGKTLVYLSAARFDQQTTTKPHLDGGPEECFLMLGYEPSEIDAELQFSDYTKCAHELGMSPTEFMAKHNPMFRTGQTTLQPFTTRVSHFSKADYQIVCINNSTAAFSTETPKWQGVLHTATILTPDESKRRVINSTMIASAPIGTPETITAALQHDFIHTTIVRRQGYDKSHLRDDE